LGRAVWYGPGADEAAGDTDALLEDTLVLDAVWLSRAFVQVLEDTPTREAGGMLDHRRFPDIWTDHGRPEWYKYSPDEYQRVALMMRRFDVALPTRASSGERSLVPQLVPEIRPKLPWTAPEDAAGRKVRLACQLDHEAEGLMARFIAATEPYHVYVGGRGLFWQEGVFLRDSFSFKNEALVTVQGSEKPLVSIVVSGDQPGFLMNELHRTLESVIDFWKGMTTTYHILCPTRAADNGYCRGDFKFETVQRRAAEAGSGLQCDDCDTKWTPEQLLHGLEAVRDRREADYQTSYLYYHQKRPCPRTFLLRPADRKWHKVTSWAGIVGERFHLTLVSELSGKEVKSKEFSIRKEWTKWLGPLTRVASMALTGLAVPLGGDLATQLSEGAAALDKLAGLPTAEGGAAAPEDTREARQRDGPLVATDAQLHQLLKLLKRIGLDPRESGMDMAETRDGRWLWMTVEEAATHDRPEARIG
ncbi:MAG: hypothetical protein IID49_15630, partial [Proteobacteria bacterium]|nr:hypothetical protein [Pseudomonadota bacterium]